MPTITNFGDVVTTGNTVLQGNLSVLNTSTILTGNLLPNVTATANIGQLSAQFGSSYIQQMNAATLNITSQTYLTNVSIASNLSTPLANITTLNAATVIATTGFYGPVVGSNVVSASNVYSANALTTTNVFVNNVTATNTVSVTGNVYASNAVSTNNVIATNTVSVTGNVYASNAVSTNNVIATNTVSVTGNVYASNALSTTNLFANTLTMSNTVSSISVTGNVFASNALTTTNLFANTLTMSNALSSISVTGNVYAGNALSTTNLFANTLTALSSISVAGNVYAGNAVTTTNLFANTLTMSNALSSISVTGNIYAGNAVSTTNVFATSAVLTNNLNASNSITTANLITNNIIMSSNLSTGATNGNVYVSANLVVNGNIFSVGGSVGSGSGTSQGYTLVLPSSYTLGTAFVTGTGSPVIQGFHINLSLFTPQAAQSVTAFSTSTGMVKFTAAGLYQITCVLSGDQPISRVAIGSSSSSSFGSLPSSTTAYQYVYNVPLGSSPSIVITLPLTVTDVSKYYYLDAFFQTGATVLYQTTTGSAAGTNYGTYIQVSPFGNYLSSATGVASALLCNCGANSNLSSPYSSNTYRIALTSSNGWAVSGTSTSLAVTANGNFQVNQSGIYEVNMCLNTVGNTPVRFQVGSLLTDALAPGGTTPLYLYSYSPMYTQDPTTTVSMPLNLTNVSNVYFVEVSFPGTLSGNVALSPTSTFLSLKPIGGYINTGTNPWISQGTSVYYSNGSVGIGSVNPAALTETLTVQGNTSFVSNITSVQDQSSNLYVNSKRTPAGSLSVANYVTGSVPLTTTTSLINNYLSNAASVTTATTGLTGITTAVNFPGTSNSCINLGTGSSTNFNLTTSNIYIEAWVYVNTTLGITNFFGTRASLGNASGSEDWRIWVETNNTLNFQVFGTAGNALAASVAISPTGWHHLVGSYNATGASKTVQVYVDGTRGATVGTFTGTIRYTATANTYIGLFPAGGAGAGFNGQIADMRIVQGCIVPTGASITVPSTSAPGIPFSLTTLPASCTAASGNVIALALVQSYFPGASTSPYGPCLTLPGTVGSYYQQNSIFSSSTMSGGFTVECWVNFASLASSNVYNGGWTGTTQPAMIGEINATTGNINWAFGPINTGKVTFGWWNTVSGINALNSSGTITTGQWNHLVIQSNAASYVNMYINGVQQTLTAQGGYAPTGNGTTSVLIASINTYDQPQIVVGQFYAAAGTATPNFAIAKARLISGANTYTVTSFTPSPNLGAIPVGGTVAWQLETQYPLPTFSSIQDVTQLPPQSSSYGALPTPVGGVTSNVLSPPGYTTLQSLRFDGTGYIDYGNAASSSLTTNIWANAVDD
jgi:hypothetical protein